MSARAGIVVTGTEVLTGRVQDRNGPWLADRLLERVVEHHLAALEAPHHLGRQIVRGRAEPAARDDQIDTLRGQEAQLSLHVLGPVAADRDVGQLDPQFQQPVGEPGAVAVPHATG